METLNSSILVPMSEKRKISLDVSLLRRESLSVDIDDIARAFKCYFTNLVTTNSPNQDDIQECIQALDLKIIRDMNHSLNRPYMREDVELAFKQMTPLKCLVPYGFGSCFYQ